mmetsp:Transcript_88162/g.254416  ORF Transcript_88162/g.254416 Transcript_88162/m.254416 type:complete len:241 (+) Transcript_88162:347-1069(+)
MAGGVRLLRGVRQCRGAALYSSDQPNRIAMLRANIDRGQTLPAALRPMPEVGEDVVRVALAVVSLRGEDPHRLLDEAAVRVRDDRHAARLQHAVHLSPHSPRVRQVLHAQGHGHDIEGAVLPWQPRVAVEVLRVALRRYRIHIELGLVEAMDDDPCTLEHLRREVRNPRGAQVQHREAGGKRREDTAVNLGEALKRHIVEVIYQPGLGVHVGVGGLVDPREVVGGVRPRRWFPTMLRAQS